MAVPFVSSIPAEILFNDAFDLIEKLLDMLLDEPISSSDVPSMFNAVACSRKLFNNSVISVVLSISFSNI